MIIYDELNQANIIMRPYEEYFLKNFWNIVREKEVKRLKKLKKETNEN